MTKVMRANAPITKLKLKLKQDDQPCISSSTSLISPRKLNEETQSCVEVIPGLFLGNYRSACNEQTLLVHKIDVIVNLVSALPNKFPDHIIYENFTVADVPSFDLNESIEGVLPIIHRHLSSEKRVFVHCRHGISRSPSVILAYLMRYSGMSFDQAFTFLRNKKANIDPNFGFLVQLQRIK